MLKIKLLCLLIVNCAASLFAQKATLKIQLENTATKNITLSQPKLYLSRNFLNQGYREIALDDSKMISQTFNFVEPQFIDISAYDNLTKKSLKYSLYISPGDDLNIIADFSKEELGLEVTGKGSNNNQPLLNKKFDINTEPFIKDTLPARIIEEINRNYMLKKANFEAYQQKHRPSKELVRDWNLKLKYGQMYDYYDFKSSMKYNIGEAYYRNIIAWNKVQDSLFTTKDMNNDNALRVREYLQLTGRFLLRTKEELWKQSQDNPVWFYKEFYQSDTSSGKKIFQEDMSNDFKERIINKYFTGKTAAYLYAVLLDEALKDADPKNLSLIFNRFKDKFPKDEYVNLFANNVNEVVKKQKQALTDKMVFVKNNGEDLITFDEVLALVKGKTVLLDMWGTWCAPCREDMEKHGKKIKTYFKDKGLDYLYVANFDTNNRKTWKELISYFELEGTHILANNQLTTDIMSKTKGQGYPTYILIKKDATFELLKGGLPQDITKLFDHIDELLASQK